ncbi:phage tail tube protein [Salibacterium lacus]|uniref:Phage tail tube protein n=1 Tax=Salibacterium lacus TaxID=1898109 RepID=A0ABW5T168_9BACI
MAQPIDPTRVVNGNWVFVYDENGNWLAESTAFEATAEGSVEDVSRAGTKGLGKKITTIDRTGTLTLNKVSTRFINLIRSGFNNTGPAFVTELNVKIEDPDNGGTERWRYKGVQFSTLPSVSSENGSLMTQEFSFTFTDEELVQSIDN